MQLKRLKQRGYTMVEIMLGLIIVSVVGIGAASLMADAQKDMKSVADGELLVSFQQAAVQHYLNDRSNILAATENGSGADETCRLGINPSATDPLTTGAQANNVSKHTCAIDAAFLKWKKLLPLGFPDTNSRGQRLVAIYKQVYEGSDPTNDVEILVVGASEAASIPYYAPNAISERNLDLLVKTAQVVGASGGYIPDGDRGVCKWTASQKQACGTHGAWQVDVSQFVN